MLIDLLPFQFKIDLTTLAGIGLWALALYLGFSPVSEWVMVKLENWMNLAERSLYTSTQEYERSRKASESLNALLASLLSIIPFLIVGGFCNWGVEASLGRSWTISMGIISCIGCGVYELGRRDGQSME
ncbi:MAG TPA: hypothetical protein V6C57_22220 [Coleofasciculaceae cyanobacterium]